MKTKVFEGLKREYARLGLDDSLLQALADSLVGTGLITDDNLQSVVTSQSAYLEGLQRSNDKRVTDALKKADEKAKAEATRIAEATRKAQEEAQTKYDAIQKQLEELRKTEPKDEPNAIPDWYKAERDARTAKDTEIEELLKALKASNEDSKKKVEQLENEKALAEKKANAEARQASIVEKARKLEIPEWRIQEGFVIGEDKDETFIDDYLGKVSSNIKNQTLPERGAGFSFATKDVTKEQTDALAGTLIR